LDELRSAVERWNSMVQRSSDVQEMVAELRSGKLRPAFNIPGFAKLVVLRPVFMSTDVYPVAEEGIPLRTLYEDLDPWMLRNAYAGCFARLSEDELTNVHLHGAISAVYQLAMQKGA